MKGDLVLAKTYGGVPMILRVWAETTKGVWLTDEANYQLLIKGQGGMEPILGFPRKDVFKCDPETTTNAQKSWKAGTWDWNDLAPY